VTAAGMSRAPVVKRARPAPRLIAPNANSQAMSAAVTARPVACDNAKSPATTTPKQVAGVIRTCAKRRVMTVAIANMAAISMASPSPTGDTLPLNESETMIATPQMTAAIAAQVAGATRSRNIRKAISAAISGTPACISRIFATVV
jgi:hypothetical protein